MKKLLLLLLASGFLTGCAAQIPELSKTSLPDGIVIVSGGVQTTISPAQLVAMLGITNGLPGAQGQPGKDGVSFTIPTGTPDGYIPFAQASAPNGLGWTSAVLQISTVQKKGQTVAGLISSDRARVGSEWLSAYLNITSITSGSVSVQYSYTDSNGVVQTKTLGTLSAKGSQSWISVMDNTVGSAVTTSIVFAAGTVATFDISYQLSDMGK